MPRRALVLLLAPLALATASCSPSAADREADASAAPATFAVEIAMQAPTKLSGCATGDLLPDRPGHEIAAVGSDGSIYVVWQENGTWSSETIATTPGEMIQCAIGDADPTRPGLELVTVGIATGGEDDGGPGQAHLFYRDGDEWRGEMIFEDTALIHGVCIGDVDPTTEGVEICTVGFSNVATIVRRGEDGSWSATKAVDLGSPGKTVVPHGRGAVVACAAGTVVWFARDEKGAWERSVIDEAEAGQARIASDGTRVLTGRDDGGLGLIADGSRRDIHQESAKLRGAVLADLDSARAGVEAATAGYLGHVTVLYEADGEWQALRVFSDTQRYHHLTAGRAGTSERTALVAANYSGRLVVIRRTSAE